MRGFCTYWQAISQNIGFDIRRQTQNLNLVSPYTDYVKTFAPTLSSLQFQEDWKENILIALLLTLPDRFPLKFAMPVIPSEEKKKSIKMTLQTQVRACVEGMFIVHQHCVGISGFPDSIILHRKKNLSYILGSDNYQCTNCPVKAKNIYINYNSEYHGDGVGFSRKGSWQENEQFQRGPSYQLKLPSGHMKKANTFVRQECSSSKWKPHRTIFFLWQMNCAW